MQNLKSNTPKWITGEIVKKLGPLSYSVQIDGVQHKRHVDQLLPSTEQVTFPSDRTTEDFFMPTSLRQSTNNEAQPTNEPTIRRNPPRARKPPDRLTY